MLVLLNTSLQRLQFRVGGLKNVDISKLVRQSLWGDISVQEDAALLRIEEEGLVRMHHVSMETTPEPTNDSPRSRASLQHELRNLPRWRNNQVLWLQAVDTSSTSFLVCTPAAALAASQKNQYKRQYRHCSSPEDTSVALAR